MGPTSELTVHVSFMFILNEGIATRFSRSLVVDNVDLGEKKKTKGKQSV